jgi:quinol monooxygenase YgiN
MTFQAELVGDFLQLFNHIKHQIRTFPGCQHLELLQDFAVPHIFYTYSYWVNEIALENYRQSDLFKKVWAETKVLFADKPQAFSAIRKETVQPN